MTRKSELLRSKWPEFDLDAAQSGDRLERNLSRINLPDAGAIAAPDLIVFHSRVEATTTRWLQGSDDQTPDQVPSRDAERLRGWGIEAEASWQATRGVSRRSVRGWERQPGAAARTSKKRGEHKSGPAFRATRSSALQAWAEITKVLAASPDPADRKLSKSIVDFVMQTDVARAVQRHRAAQRQTELPGMNMDRGGAVQRVSPERSCGPDMSR